MSSVSLQLTAPYLIVRGTDTDITVGLEQYGAAVTVTSVSATVYDAQGNAIGTYTDSNTTTPTVTVLGTDTSGEELSERWRVDWTLDGRVVQASAQLVRYDWTPSLTDADLYRRAPALDPAGPAPVSARSTFEPERLEAVDCMRDRLMSAGRRPWLVVEPHRLREPLVLLALALIYEGFAGRDAMQLTMAQHYREQFDRAFAALSFLYDDDEDGAADDDHRMAARPTVWL